LKEVGICDGEFYIYIGLKVLKNQNVRTVLAKWVKNLPFLIG
jgi:hypothetical protein